MNEELKKIIEEVEARLPCNCDLDRWEPEPLTGHSFICRIHKTIKAECVKLLTMDKKEN